MCDICHKTVCCCEKKISVTGKRGENGQRGPAGPQGPPGPAGGVLFVDYKESAGSINISQDLGNLNTQIPFPTANIVIPSDGLYEIFTNIGYLDITIATARLLSANAICSVTVNGTSVSDSLFSPNDFEGHWEFSMHTPKVVSLTAGDVVNGAIKMQTPNTDETLLAQKFKVMVKKLS